MLMSKGHVLEKGYIREQPSLKITTNALDVVFASLPTLDITTRVSK